MSARKRRWVIGTAAVVAALAIAGTIFFWMRSRPYDPSFDTRVADPAYRTEHPRVLYDEGHLNTHTSDAAYRPFAELIRSDGYAVEAIRTPIAKESLTGAAVFVVVCARGRNDANDAPAFSEPEAAVIERWVRAGGSLFLVTDHWPFGAAVEPLAQRFGVRMGKGMVEDAQHSDSSLGESSLVFSRENGLLREHPIVRGRNPGEEIRHVLTFTGQSLLGPPDSVAFLALSDGATERPPTVPQVEKSGGDVRVKMNYGEPMPAKGRAQGIALEVDRGRIVILGEAGMLRAQRERNGSLVGMNHPGTDNRQLALNIMHWLSRAL